MANTYNKYQLKRTSVSGRTPNTTSTSNSSFLDTAELALNLTDKKMFSSNGTALFEIGANLSSISVTGNTIFGNTTINGFANITGTLAAGNTTITGLANVTTLNSGNVTVTGVANVTGNVSVTDTMFGNNVVLTGNLTVSGTTTYINTVTLNVGDNIVTLNADWPTITPTENAGIEVNRGSLANVQFVWDETNDRWTTNSQPMFIGGTLAAGNTTVTGSANVSTTLNVIGAATVNGALVVNNTAALGNTTVTGFANVSSFLNVVGAATVNGALVVNNTAATGNLTVTGFANVSSLNITGAATVNGAVTINNTAAFGNTTITGFVNVSSYGTFGGTVNATALNVGANVRLSTTSVIIGNTTVNTSISATAITSNATLAVGNTTVTGFITTTGTANVAALNVGANVNLTTSSITVGNSTVNTVHNQTNIVIGNTTVNTTVSATAITSSATLAIGNTTVTGFANVSSTLNVVGAATVNGALTVNNTAATGNLTVTGLTSTTTANVSSSLNVVGAATVNGALTVNNTAALGNTTTTGFVNVSSYGTFGGTVNAAAINVGANVNLSTTSITVGNSTVNTTANSTLIGNQTIGGPNTGIMLNGMNMFAFSNSSGNEGNPTFRSSVANNQTVLRVLPNGIVNVATQAQFEFFGVDYFSNTTNWHNFRILAQTDRFVIDTARGANSDPARPIVFDIGGTGQSNATNANYPAVLVLSANGKVGISNATPDATLTVTGTANVSGNVAVGGTLSVTGINASGNTTITGFLNVSSYGTFGGTVNATALNIGANVNLSTTQLNVGNTTVNAVLTSTSLLIANSANVTTNGHEFVLSANTGSFKISRDIFAGGQNITLQANGSGNFLYFNSTNTNSKSAILDVTAGGSTTVDTSFNVRIEGTTKLKANSTIVTITGAANVTGPFTVSNTTSLSGNTTITGFANVSTTLNVVGAATVNGALTVNNTAALGNTTITGSANVSSTLNVVGAATVNGALTVNNTAALGNTTITGFANASSLNVVGAAVVNGAFTVNNTASVGNTTITGFANVSTTLNVVGAATVNGALTVNNTAAFGNTTITGTLGTGNTTITGNLTVTGNTTANNIRTTGSVQIDGDLTVSGNTITINATDLAISDNLIYLNEPETDVITSATSNGSAFIYTSNNTLSAGLQVTITGINPSGYNVTANTITLANATHFAVANTTSPGSYVSGGSATAQVAANPDVGFIASYNDGTSRHAGFFRDATDGVFKVFDQLVPEPSGAFVDTANNTFRIADFQSNNTIMGSANVAGTTRLGVSNANYLQVVGAASAGVPTISAQGTDASIDIGYATKSGANHYFRTNGTVDQFVVAHTASAVNYAQATGAVTGAGPTLSAQGSDTNVDFNVLTKGTGGINLRTGNGIGFRIYDGSGGSPQVNFFAARGRATGSGPYLTIDGTDTNISANFGTKGTGVFSFLTASTTLEQFRIAHTASAVNYLQVTGAATGGRPSVTAAGSDTNIDLALYSKGTGGIAHIANNALQMYVAATASAVNYVQVNGAATGGSLIISAQGSDTNIPLILRSKGAFATELQSSAGPVLFQALPVASSVNYLRATPAIASSGPVLSAQGSDTNIDVNLTTKGTGAHIFNTGGGQQVRINDATTAGPYTLFSRDTFNNAQMITAANTANMYIQATGGGAIRFNTAISSETQVAIERTVSAVNFLRFTGSATGSAASISALGADANVGVSFAGKGSGTLNLNSNTTFNANTLLFTGSNTSITLRVADNGVLSFEGGAGQLFSIANNLTGQIFAVNDISGIPSLEVYSNGQVNVARYGGNVSIGTSTSTLTVNGAVSFGNAATFSNTITVTGTATFSNTIVANGALNITAGANAITFTNATSNYIAWNSAGVAAPTATSRSFGTKLVLWPGLSATSVDYAIGVESNFLWFSADVAASGFKWYSNTTNIMTATTTGLNIQSGGLSIGGTSAIDSSRNGSFANVTIAGNLTVSGTTTYINTTTLNIGDNIITLNADLPGATAPTENAGIEVNRGSSANVSFIWDETNDVWASQINGVSKLTVSNTNVNVTGNTSLFLGGMGSEGGELIFANTAGGSGPIIDVDGGNDWRYNTYNNTSNYKFNTGASATTKLQISANGNVGIGNTTPIHLLRVEGTGSFSSTLQATTFDLGSSMFFGTSGGNPVINFDSNDYLLYNKTTNLLTFAIGGTAQLTQNTTVLYASANVGIGNSAPTDKLRVEGTLSHLGLVPSTGTGIDQIFTATPSITLNTTWQSTGVTSTNLANGTYVVQLLANDIAAGGTANNEYYSGMMSWYSADTNSTVLDEIPLHRAGVSGSNNAIFLATQRTATANTSDLLLMISSAANNSSASTYTIKFRRMI